MARQRDTTYNANWTNGEGYNDGTAGAALNNVMREKRTAAQPFTRNKENDGTRLVSVARPKKAIEKQPVQKIDSETMLKSARTVFTIMQQVAQLKGFSLTELVLEHKETKQRWVREQLMAPQPKK